MERHESLLHSHTDDRIRWPLLGQHTDAVLHAYLGMTDAQISTLRQEGVIGTKR